MPIDLGNIPTGTPPTTGEKLQIRTAIGLGQTDAPTFASLTVTTTAGANVFSTGAAALQNAGFLGVARAINLIDTAGISWSSTSALLGATGTNLLQDAPGILAQRNGDAAQAFRLYNFYNTAGANYERGEFVWSGNTLFIQAIGAGSGVAQPLSFGGASISFRTSVGAGYVARWNFSTTGHFLAATDNLYDIGASGANRPKDLHVAGQLYLGGVVRTSGGIKWNVGGTVFVESSNGVVSLQSSSGADFGRLQLGSTADTHPAIARDGAGIKITGAAAGLTSWIKVPAVAVSALPSASTAGAGARSFVNDALTPVFGSAVTGGGAVTVPVYSTGSAWNVG
jgi:hypothetical protein